jgi:uncharacterized protein
MQWIIPGFTELFILDKAATLYHYEIWRIVTSIFLHGGVAHLLYNLFALALFGIILERIIGSRRFLLVFFFSGILANIVSVNFYESSLGASGAIYGILGCLAVIRPMMMVWVFGIPMPMFIAAILWVGGSILGIFIPSNIGDIAHLSGIVVGFLAGLFLRGRFAERKITGRRVDIPDEYMQEWEDRYMR